MLHSEISSSHQLAALNRLIEISTSYCVSQVFFSACQLGVFEQLGTRPMTADELSQSLKLHPDGCQRLLAVLRNLGLVERDGDLYRNTSPIWR
jgi:predicted transcriptional regulator